MSPGKALLFFLIFLMAADAAVTQAAESSDVVVTATIISKGNCKFKTGPSPLSFANLNPMNPVERTESTTASFSCTGKDTIFAISDDDGENETAPDAHRLRHATDPAAFIPYDFAYDPAGGTAIKNTDITLTITATIQGAGYQDAPAGNYSDLVLITIQP
jgi:spore coat protein U-like protein